MGRGSRAIVRWKNDRQRKKKQRDDRGKSDRGKKPAKSAAKK